jgi:hypothetical protein
MMILVTVAVQIQQHCPDSLEHSPATANFAGEKLKFLHCKLHRSFITRFGISVNLSLDVQATAQEMDLFCIFTGNSTSQKQT